MEWEGIVGRATYEADASTGGLPRQAFAPFWKFLKFGELVHVGHSATFGLGRYRVGVADSVRRQSQPER